MKSPGVLTALKLLTKALMSWQEQLSKQNELLQRLADRFAPLPENGADEPEVMYTNDEQQAKDEFKERLRAAGYDPEALDADGIDGSRPEAAPLA